MPPSYRAINYSLRPAKSIERKMLCEAFSRLYPFQPVEKYMYVGMGSIYFSDFLLFHRSLGIRNMISMEKDAHARECFEFNKPHDCIAMDFRAASLVIPDLDWTNKTIAWLDYDDTLNSTVLSDICSVCARACSGSVLVVTVNAQPDRQPSGEDVKDYKEKTGQDYDIDRYRLWMAQQRLGEKMPDEFKGQDLRGRGLAALSHALIDSEIRTALSARNGTRQPERHLHYEQIFNFHYSDGAQMVTVGGLFYEEWHKDLCKACRFSDLHYVRTGNMPYRIEPPCLTTKEIQYLNAQLPLTPREEVAIQGVPLSDINHFSELYRYFPAYAETFFQ